MVRTQKDGQNTSVAFFRKKTACIIDTSGFWLHTAAATASAPQGPPPRKGLGGIGRTGPTLKGFAPCFRFAAESSRSVSALPQLGQGGQASSGPTMSSNSQEQEEQ